MDAGLAVLHVVVGLLFLGHGSQKLFGAFGGPGPEGTAGMMESLGMRPARLHAFLAGFGEFAGGALIALGLLTPLGALLVISVMVVAIATVHWEKGLWAGNGGYELNLVYAVIAFALVAVGPGEISLDHALGLDLTGLGWALAAAGIGIVGGLGALVTGHSAGRGASSAQAHGA